MILQVPPKPRPPPEIARRVKGSVSPLDPLNKAGYETPISEGGTLRGVG